MKISNTKFNVSFSAVKPFLLMALFILCILNAGIVRADQSLVSASVSAVHVNAIADGVLKSAT